MPELNVQELSNEEIEALQASLDLQRKSIKATIAALSEELGRRTAEERLRLEASRFSEDDLAKMQELKVAETVNVTSVGAAGARRQE